MGRASWAVLHAAAARFPHNPVGALADALLQGRWAPHCVVSGIRSSHYVFAFERGHFFPLWKRKQEFVAFLSGVIMSAII